jgi:hypothetical protein
MQIARTYRQDAASRHFAYFLTTEDSPSSGEFDLGFSCAVIHSFSPRDWHVLSCVLSNSIEEVLFTIVVEGGTLSSLPKRAQPLQQGGLDRESWAIEFSRQRIDTDWYFGTRSFEPSKIRVSLSEFGDIS